MSLLVLLIFSPVSRGITVIFDESPFGLCSKKCASYVRQKVRGWRIRVVHGGVAWETGVCVQSQTYI